jgi:TrpR-related protein YerC/YecD
MKMSSGKAILLALNVQQSNLANERETFLKLLGWVFFVGMETIVSPSNYEFNIFLKDIDSLFVLMYYHVMTNVMNDPKTKSLFNAFLQLESEEEVARFCRDLMTEPEIEEFAARWLVAKELDKGKSQRLVSLETKVSIATVTRVNQWLQRGMGGYKLVLARLNSQKDLANSNFHHHPQ